MSQETINGSIEHIVYADEESGFTVAHLKTHKKEKVCIVGTLPLIHPGEVIHCTGNWTNHPSFGKQFSVDLYEIHTPHDIKGIEKYLESGMIKGIGPVYAKRIVSYFKEQTLHVLDESPHRLVEIEGLGSKRIDKIIESWSAQKHVRKVMIFLRGHNIGPSLAQKIFKKFGDKSIDLLKENPYIIAREIYGIGFKTADKIAQSIGIPLTAPQRIACGIEHKLTELSDEGNTCFQYQEFLRITEEMLDVEQDKIVEQLYALEKEERINISALDTDETKYIWLSSYYASELGISNELLRLVTSDSTVRSVKTEQALDWIEQKMQISFAPEQASAVKMCLNSKLAIITGGPGTGKSTITNAIVEIFSQLSDNILLAAPTGKAAKRMTEINKKKAFTIHSILEFDFVTKGFKRNKQNPISADLIIIDEASMIDTFLMYHLLKAIPSTAKLIFIGDIDQLPSVGAGNVLKDLIASSCIPTMRLKEIFRQAKGSKIITNAHKINHGLFPDLKNSYFSDFIYINKTEPQEILEEVLSLVATRLPQKRKLDPIEDIQVLCPMKRGVIGIDNLNTEMQKALNPNLTKVEKMGRKFLVGDKVMQIRNNYNKKVYNGDVGIIQEISHEEELVIVRFDFKEVEYEFSELDELVLSYACSIHKYQGSECRCVIIPIHTSHFKLLYRNLLYTGITRGKKLVILVGSKKAIAIATKNESVQKRYTGLVVAIQKHLPLIHDTSTPTAIESI